MKEFAAIPRCFVCVAKGIINEKDLQPILWKINLKESCGIYLCPDHYKELKKIIQEKEKETKIKIIKEVNEFLKSPEIKLKPNCKAKKFLELLRDSLKDLVESNPYLEEILSDKNEENLV